MSETDFADGAALVAALAAASAADLANTTNFLLDAKDRQTQDMARAYVALFDAIESDPNLSYKMGRYLELHESAYRRAQRFAAGEEWA